MLWARRWMVCRRRGWQQMWPLDGTVPQPMEREPIKEPLQTGLRVLDGMLTVGRGQRVGIFGGSGVGKSTLIGMMTRNTAADLTVVGLVGERGREVREFVEDSLGEEGRQAVGGAGVDFGSEPSAADAGGDGGDVGGGVLCGARKACFAGAGFVDAICDGGARGWAWRRVSHRRARDIRRRCLHGWRSWWSGQETFATEALRRSIQC